MEPWSNLSAKVIMVTEASPGLGREFCLDLAKAGGRIIAAARRVDHLKSLCDDINRLTPHSSNGPVAIAVELDGSAAGATIEKAVQQAWEAYGRIDALVNNAGSWLVSKYVCMRVRDAKRGGSLINISSIAGLDRVQAFGVLAYASSKAALRAMTKVLALELGAHNIRVNAMAPRVFRSEITKCMFKKQGLSNFIAKVAPLRSLGTTDPALTSLIRYLIHDSSAYVSGNIFVVDAGTTLPGVPIFSSL
ncbi:hypothetical protein SLEP1_g47528 [Rubroshorea leprosula]|uniref:Uncharacterized protein n=1 Tax=Rubroshorea leprosula TaxID=152421 RepID=A0AAV5LSP0_9ROSI|nr:hypothetical protein SLEP1_g47528 [Rubroshorea leprosula]